MAGNRNEQHKLYQQHLFQFVFSKFHNNSTIKGDHEYTHLTVNSQDLISNSPYCLSYSSCDVSLENLVLDQLSLFSSIVYLKL